MARLTYVVWYGCNVTWSTTGRTSAAAATTDRAATRRRGRCSHHAMPYRRQHGERGQREEQLAQAVVEVGAEHDRRDRHRERLHPDEREPPGEHPVVGAVAHASTTASTVPVSAKSSSRVGRSSARWRGTYQRSAFAPPRKLDDASLVRGSARSGEPNSYG